MLKRNKDQIKGTIKIPTRLRSTCLSLFFPTGNFPCGNTAAVGVFTRRTALGSAEHCWELHRLDEHGWLIPNIYGQGTDLGNTRVGQSDWGDRSSWNFFPGLTSAWSFPIPAPTCKSAQGLTAVEPAGPVWLGTVLGTEVWHRPSGARLALVTNHHPSLPPRIWGGD